MKTSFFFTFTFLIFYSALLAQNVNISGLVTTEPGCDEPVPGVTLLLEDRTTGETFETTTGADGIYSFTDLASNHNWALTPSRDETDLCGLDAADVTAIQQHILHSIPLPSEYARIAADVSADGEIGLQDLIALSQYTIGLNTGFTPNWRFVDANHVFSIPDDEYEIDVSYQFPSAIEIANLSQNAVNQNFIAIKMGEVNCTYVNTCDESNLDCEAGCRTDNIPSIAICEPRLEGNRLIYPVRYYAPNGVDNETFAAAVIRITVQEDNPNGCISIIEDATENSGDFVTVINMSTVEYEFLNTGAGVTLTNNDLLFELVVEGTANCCVNPEFFASTFIYNLGNIPFMANQCDMDEFCFESVTIMGTIESVTGGTEAVENVELIITDQAGNQYCAGLMTGLDGKYSCEVIPDITYTVRPLKDNKHCLGVTQSDIKTLADHLIGLTPLITPFQQISADVNNDNVLNTFDLVDMQSVIICNSETFPNNTSWRFVDPLYQWANDPLPPVAQNFAEEIILEPTDLFPGGFYIADFQAMKIGDVNGSCPGPSCMSCCGHSEGPPKEESGKRMEEEDLTDNLLSRNLERIIGMELSEEQKNDFKKGYLVSNIYPNPFETDVVLEIFSLTQKNATLRIFDSVGKLVNVQDLILENGFQTYRVSNLGNLPTGIYFSQLLIDGHVIVNKLIKS